ncbi:type VI secretion system baseplate subunit TssG [Loktanella sp. D2R18]|uniref:type VI secretion system baseplate subunit TssG n=1 Tax=Rhodobacterales TaxID=204455 RepID=UPI000DEAF578|nr:MULTISPECIES: type VI secretion system baseplate subunit TssG [Rhodobacterales]MDO6590545.1 type VI secretion system baseplate subunit TssG [Yoonia sp. 1_MG-2023]RBW41306.1 type VI secretion system baseplate subunit TssG [Loktanella sp. D2R18]
MASQKREADSDLTRLAALRDEPHAYHIFQALRLIEATHPDKPRLGRSQRPSEDPVRLTQDVDLAFPTSTISDFAEDPEGGPDRLSQRMFGLFGPNGALPLHITEYARDRQRNDDDPTFIAFADMFHHRMMSLLYRAWASGQPAISFDRPDDDPFDDKVAAFAGFSGQAFEDRDAMPDLAKRHFAGLMGGGPRHEAGLQAIIAQFFNADVRIENFVGSWLVLEPHDRAQLGGVALGQNTTLGEKVWSREAKFRVLIGPLDQADYDRLLPNGASFKRLTAIIRNYVGDMLDWEVNLILRASDVPPTALGQSCGLGLTSWIGQRPDRDADDLSLSPPVQHAL